MELDLDEKALAERDAETSRKALQIAWSKLEELAGADPYRILEELDELKRQCDEVLAAKTALVESLDNKLSQKDEEYARTLRNQETEIRDVVSQMQANFDKMRKNYEEELAQLEESFMRQRSDLLKANREEMDVVVEERRALEVSSIEQRQKMIAEYHEKIDETRRKDMEEYQLLKMEKEQEAATLEQQLEDMRATYQLNAEKLEYNYRVLNERDIETSNLISQNKRKIGKLGDLLAKAVAAYEKSEKHHRHDNDKLTADYKAATERFHQLQEKFKHFEADDAKRFRETWSLHQEEFIARLAKIVIADQSIHREVLGIQWEPPAEMTQLLRELGLVGHLRQRLEYLSAGIEGPDLDWLVESETAESTDPARDESEFWKRLSHLFPARRTQLWTNVERGLQELHSTLLERTKLYEQNSAIAAQNEELRGWLREHLASEVNDQLIVPPARIVHEEPAVVMSGAQRVAMRQR
ncbi:Sperm tail C-terminal domain [Carpediemonas membranifera]|uniref:Sperm tail C-terminal domain n=1 Tax=Carpediemonas membranifera TaxID=201153 RepID=A0A8J6AWS4_9EUKA|nr:Sperm tail C-terminal domain [Carpediemonas membranifera]|eukprot:KAG9396796.1 Sperm tail C-terminal domain [Carpediemonas membranifera]